MIKKPIIVNLLGGSGIGKSTISAEVFAKLKWEFVECEFVTEYAKIKVWEESFKVLEDQIYVFGKQLHNMSIVRDKVDVIITDCPLLLSLTYGRHLPKCFKDLVLYEHNKLGHNLNILLERSEPFNPKGRVQKNIVEAIELDEHIKQVLIDNHLNYIKLMGSHETSNQILEIVMDHLNNQKTKV